MPTHLRIGNSNPKEAYRREVDHREHTPDRLVELAKAADVPTTAGDGTPIEPALLAARLSAVNHYRPVSLPENHDGAVLHVVFPAVATLPQMFADLTHPKEGIWANHSFEHSTTVPLWVETDHVALGQLLAAHWGCPIACPDPSKWHGHPDHDGHQEVTA